MENQKRIAAQAITNELVRLLSGALADIPAKHVDHFSDVRANAKVGTVSILDGLSIQFTSQATETIPVSLGMLLEPWSPRLQKKLTEAAGSLARQILAEMTAPRTLLITADLALPDGVHDRARSINAGLSMRAIHCYDIGSDEFLLRVDVLFGTMPAPGATEFERLVHEARCAAAVLRGLTHQAELANGEYQQLALVRQVASDRVLELTRRLSRKLEEGPTIIEIESPNQLKARHGRPVLDLERALHVATNQRNTALEANGYLQQENAQLKQQSASIAGSQTLEARIEHQDLQIGALVDRIIGFERGVRVQLAKLAAEPKAPQSPAVEIGQ